MKFVINSKKKLNNVNLEFEHILWNSSCVKEALKRKITDNNGVELHENLTSIVSNMLTIWEQKSEWNIHNYINKMVDSDCHSIKRADVCEKERCSAVLAVLFFMMWIWHHIE